MKATIQAIDPGGCRVEFTTEDYKTPELLDTLPKIKEYLLARGYTLPAHQPEGLAGQAGTSFAARELVPAAPVRESMLQHEVLPLLDDRGRRIPEERELKEDDIVPEQPLLLDVDVDIEARIVTIQVHEVDIGHPSRGACHVAIDVRVLVAGVGVVDEEPCHAPILVHGTGSQGLNHRSRSARSRCTR